MQLPVRAFNREQLFSTIRPKVANRLNDSSYFVHHWCSVLGCFYFGMWLMNHLLTDPYTVILQTAAVKPAAAHMGNFIYSGPNGHFVASFVIYDQDHLTLTFVHCQLSIIEFSHFTVMKMLTSVVSSNGSGKKKKKNDTPTARNGTLQCYASVNEKWPYKKAPRIESFNLD